MERTPVLCICNTPTAVLNQNKCLLFSFFFLQVLRLFWFFFFRKASILLVLYLSYCGLVLFDLACSSFSTCFLIFFFFSCKHEAQKRWEQYMKCMQVSGSLLQLSALLHNASFPLFICMWDWPHFSAQHHAAEGIAEYSDLFHTCDDNSEPVPSTSSGLVNIRPPTQGKQTSHESASIRERPTPNLAPVRNVDCDGGSQAQGYRKKYYICWACTKFYSWCKRQTVSTKLFLKTAVSMCSVVFSCMHFFNTALAGHKF